MGELVQIVFTYIFPAPSVFEEEVRSGDLGQKDVKVVILFGSVARGEAKEDSDLDLCIVCSKKARKKTKWRISMTIAEDKDIYKPRYSKELSDFCELIDHMSFPTPAELYISDEEMYG